MTYFSYEFNSIKMLKFLTKWIKRNFAFKEDINKQ